MKLFYLYVVLKKTSLKCINRFFSPSVLGPGDTNGLGVGLCDIATKWENIPNCQMNSLLNNLYNCGCEVSYIYFNLQMHNKKRSI